jgi:Mor family transcriptional regulator
MVKKMQQPILLIECLPAAYSPSATDIIHDLLSQVLAMAPSFTAELAAQVEREAREKWGGDRVYVQRKGGTLSHRNAAIKREYQAGERIALLSRRHGLGPSRLWEIINS